MVTALIVFLGLSSCATVFILGAVALNARRSEPAYDTSTFETTSVTSAARSTSALVPAYSH